MNNHIFILHEYGSKNHYLALEVLAQKYNWRVTYLIFDIIFLFRCSIIHPSKWIFLFQNIFWYCVLPFYKKSKIVIAAAPYNRMILLLMRVLKKHDVYYHTSYSCWDGSRAVHNSESMQLKQSWHYFLNNYVKHIFSVSEKTKHELIANGYAKNDKISVVNHSYPYIIDVDNFKKKELTFLQVSKLSKSKGIEELLMYFSKHPEIQLTFVGEGELEPMVRVYSLQYENINYLGYISDFAQLVQIYKQNSFLLLNSHRTKIWEELFGMVLVEGMACGCVPVTTNHSGPCEIISQGIDGFCLPEGDISIGIDKCVEMSQKEYDSFRYQAIKKGQSFYCEKIAVRWSKIFE